MSVATRWRGRLIAVAVVFIVLAAVAGALAWHPAIAPAAPPPRGAFSQAAIVRGAQLAAVGNCINCHTVEGGVPYAGGTPLRTPFGTIHGSNITPDARTGIGTWSQAAFVRAMRDGLARDGSHLYPAFPYDHFRHASDAELQALYAFVMTRQPVDAAVPANDMVFPLQFRPLVAGWKLLFLRRTADPTQPLAAPQDAAARGAHLVQSLGHCGGCHSPRNALGAERSDRAFAGGMAEGWYAPPLNADNPSPQPWTVPAMREYLRTGLTAGHAMAGGPMQRVVAQLAQADPADVDAMAVAVVAMMASPGGAAQAQAASPSQLQEQAQRQAQQQTAAAASAQRARVPLAQLANATATTATTATATAATTATTATAATMAGALPTDPSNPQWTLGASVYAGACASCHDRGRTLGSAGALPMPLAVAVYDARPESLLRIVREGIAPGGGSGVDPGRWMPAFGDVLTDAQLTALAVFLRHSAANAPPWPDLPRAVADSAAPR